MFDLCLLQR